MSEDKCDPRIHASACGLVADLTAHRNSTGRPWITFDLRTPGGPLACVCFPTSLATLSTQLIVGNRVVVYGQSNLNGGGFRVLEAVWSDT